MYLVELSHTLAQIAIKIQKNINTTEKIKFKFMK